ncbi:hypothetical protein MUP95_00305 [bacterium]|nr:hypothetical protein [bacterium]
MIPTIRTEENKYTDLEKALRHMRSIRRHDYLVDNPGDIFITQHGDLSYCEEKFPITDCGMKRICAILGIPYFYARKIPDELSVYNINRLFRERRSELMIRTQNVGYNGEYLVTSLLPSSYCWVPNTTILEYLKKNDIKPNEICFSPMMLRVTFLSEHMIEPFPSDSIKLGWEITNSENGMVPFAVNVYLYRLICSNGMVAPEKYYGFKYRFKKGTTRLEIDATLDSAVSELYEKSGNIEQVLVAMGETQVEEDDFLSIRRKVGRFIGMDRARGEICNFASSYFDVMNRVTTLAKDQRSFKKRRDLEVLGGQILFNFMSKN